MRFEELQSEMSDRDLCSSFVMESAWPTWGAPSLPYLFLVSILSDSINSKGPMISPDGDLIWVSLGLAWGSGVPPACGGASVFVPGMR